MIMVASTGEATHYPHAYPLPVRRRSQAGAYVRLCGLLIGLLIPLFYLIGAHAQAQAAQPLTAPTCSAQAGHADHMTFNPCAHLDTTQVQDHR